MQELSENFSEAELKAIRYTWRLFNLKNFVIRLLFFYGKLLNIYCWLTWRCSPCNKINNSSGNYLWPIIDYLLIVFDNFRYAFQFMLKCCCISGSIWKCVLHDDLHTSFLINITTTSHRTIIAYLADNYRLVYHHFWLYWEILQVLRLHEFMTTYNDRYHICNRYCRWRWRFRYDCELWLRTRA